jgi:hypothetical protein
MFSATQPTGETTPHPRNTVLASLAALGSVILASSCCLPLFPFLAAAGAAGTSAFLVKLRPLLVTASLFFIAFGFHQAWRAKQCRCRPRILSAILLWFSAVVVVSSILFPQALANLVANLFGG